MFGQSESDSMVKCFGDMRRVYPNNVISSANFDKTKYRDWIDNGYTFICLNFGKGDYNVDNNRFFFRHSNIIPKYFTMSSNNILQEVGDWYGRRWYQNTLFTGRTENHGVWLARDTAYSNDCSFKVGKWELKMLCEPFL